MRANELETKPNSIDAKSRLHSLTPKNGEEKAHTCVIAFYEKVIKVKADVAAYLR